MKYSVCLASILIFVSIIRSNLPDTALGDSSGETTSGLAILQGNGEWGQSVPEVQETAPEPTETLEVPYPIEPGASTLGLIIGAVIVVLTVVGGVIYATVARRRN